MVCCRDVNADSESMIGKLSWHQTQKYKNSPGLSQHNFFTGSVLHLMDLPRSSHSRIWGIIVDASTVPGTMLTYWKAPVL